MSTAHFYRISKRFFVHIRRCQMGPLKWYRSDGFESAKGKGGKAKPEDNWRWLHIMDPSGSTWHTTILTPHRGGSSTGETLHSPDFTLAYMPHRSREAPIAAMEITTGRLNKQTQEYHTSEINTMQKMCSHQLAENLYYNKFHDWWPELQTSLHRSTVSS